MWPRRTVVRLLSAGPYGISRRAGVGGFLALIALLWTLGLLDHLHETSMHEFMWPNPQGERVNVREEVDRELSEDSSRWFAADDWYSKRTLRKPACPAVDQPLPLLVMVKSFLGNAKQRDVIRKTWAAVAQKRGARVVFIVGYRRGTKPLEEVELEADANDDLLVIDAVDEYRNNTLKLMHALSYQARGMFCGDGTSPVPANFLLLIDDDYAVSMANLFDLLAERSSDDEVYEGWRFHTSPFRFRLHKHRVSLEDYPFAEYPPYISAGAVLLSRRTALEFHLAVKHLRKFNFDDVYAGIVARSLSVTPTHNLNFKFWASWRDDDWSTTILAHGYNAFALKYAFAKFKELRS